MRTIEGCPESAGIASQNFKESGMSNIRQYIGTFGDFLPGIFSSVSPVDLVFFDGNHRREPVLNYFNQCLQHVHNDSLLIFDDIHWSEEMEQAWKTIRNHPAVTLTIDVFFCGLVFFKKELAGENYVIRY